MQAEQNNKYQPAGCVVCTLHRYLPFPLCLSRCTSCSKYESCKMTRHNKTHTMLPAANRTTLFRVDFCSIVHLLMHASSVRITSIVADALYDLCRVWNGAAIWTQRGGVKKKKQRLGKGRALLSPIRWSGCTPQAPYYYPIGGGKNTARFDGLAMPWKLWWRVKDKAQEIKAGVEIWKWTGFRVVPHTMAIKYFVSGKGMRSTL